MSHIALGTTRVMRTCAMMGEVVGMACAVCLEGGVDPHDVYSKRFDRLRELMNWHKKSPNRNISVWTSKAFNFLILQLSLPHSLIEQHRRNHTLVGSVSAGASLAACTQCRYIGFFIRYY